MQNLVKRISTTSFNKAAFKSPAKSSSTPKKGGTSGGHDSRNQVIKQMLYEKEHEINAERRMVAAKDAARLKKRISPVEYARNQDDPEQMSRQEKDYIERIYAIYKQEEFKKEFNVLNRQSLSIIAALEELKSLDSKLFLKCFQSAAPIQIHDSAANEPLSKKSTLVDQSNEQVSLTPGSAPLPLFPKRMRIPAETISSLTSWDYDMKPPSLST